MQREYILTIDGECDPSLLTAIENLQRLAKELPDVVKRFFEGLASPADLISVDSNQSSAAGAIKLWVSFKPSNRFLDFLAAAAGDREFSFSD